MTARHSNKPLAGWRVLVPRGGEWGNNIAASLRQHGATPVIAPMINFASTHNATELVDAFSQLERGEFEWLVVTSSTTVDVLVGHKVRIPSATKIAAIGEMTVAALSLAGYRVDLAPEKDNSVRGLVREWTGNTPAGTVLVPEAEGSSDALSAGLERLGITGHFVTAYRTIGVPVPADVAHDVATGVISGILITSGSVARQVQEQLAPLPAATVVVAIGPRTAFDAREAGIVVDHIAESRTADSLIEALIEAATK